MNSDNNYNCWTELDPLFLKIAGPSVYVTWAGEFPSRLLDRSENEEFFCLATDDGAIHIFDRSGEWFAGDKPSQKLESINGIAFTSRAMAVSTPQNILISVTSPVCEPPRSLPIEEGAFGIIQGDEYSFIAPLGKKGLLYVTSVSDNEFRKSLFTTPANAFFYKLARVGRTQSGTMLFAGAGRTTGLISLEVDTNGEPTNLGITPGFHSVTSSPLDIVDVLPIPSSMRPYAAVCLGIENTLHFYSDVSQESKSLGLRLIGLRGTPYSILSSDEHLFLLTSDELCVFPGLISNYHEYDSFPHKLPVYRRPIDAVDFSMAFGKYLLIIVTEGVIVLEITSMLRGLTRGSQYAHENSESDPNDSDMVVEWDSTNEFKRTGLIMNRT